MGTCEGLTQPAISVMLAQWVPANERSRLTSFVHLGATIGTVVLTLSLGPVIRLVDWAGIYYLFGVIGIIWYLLWSVLCYNSPREHPFISEREANELNEKLREHTHVNVPPVPWRHLLYSAPFWALAAASVGRDWGNYTMVTDLPKYTMSVLKLTADEVGLLYLTMNIAMVVGCVLFSSLSDWVIVKNYVSRTNVRKVMTTIGMSVHAIFPLVSSYVGCNKLHYTIAQIFSAFTASGSLPGIKANILDLSPNYAGSVMAVSHGLAGMLVLYYMLIENTNLFKTTNS